MDDTCPNIQLTDTVAIPCVGFGTYLIPDIEASALVNTAFGVGYRHVDTAEGYENESGVGEGIAVSMSEHELSREDVFVTTKLWPGNPEWGDPAKTKETTIASLLESLQRLQIDYVDLYLIHAPFCREQRLNQWRGLVELQQLGKARAVGVSNYSQAHIEEIRSAGLPIPCVNQIELHPWSQKPELVAYLDDNGITSIAYSSLVPLSTWRSKQGQESAKTSQMRAEGEAGRSPFSAMAEKYGVSEAQVLLRWAVQQKHPVLPKSNSRGRMQQNLDLFSFVIDDEDMRAIEKMDRGKSVAWPMGDPTESP
ncbi:aldo/keto reductase [Roseibium sp. SCP14]|uniref:aldo/keto reductase n=1 Tax=Roseibium sp. SCP14 TaxID=3141375 RepID=UPI00333DD7AC